MLAVFLLMAGGIWLAHSGEKVLEGIREGFQTFKHVWLLLLLALGIAGFLQVLVPHEIVSDYLGPRSGMKGLLIGWGVGAVTPGAPFTILPIAASLLKAGSGIAPVMTMVLSASLGVAVTRVPYEIAFVGWRFAVMRLLACLLLPLAGGLLVKLLNHWMAFYPRA